MKGYRRPRIRMVAGRWKVTDRLLVPPSLLTEALVWAAIRNRDLDRAEGLRP